LIAGVFKMIPLRSDHLDVVPESFNLLNCRNVSPLNNTYGPGNAPSFGFGAPIATATPRRIQFSFDNEFSAAFVAERRSRALH
jgi:hypothetical protein